MPKLEISIDSGENMPDVDISKFDVKSAYIFKELMNSLLEILKNSPNGQNAQFTIRQGSIALDTTIEQSTYDSILNDMQNINEKGAVDDKKAASYITINNIFRNNGYEYEFNLYPNGSESSKIKYAGVFKEVKIKSFTGRDNNKNRLFFSTGKMESNGGLVQIFI